MHRFLSRQGIVLLCSSCLLAGLVYSPMVKSGLVLDDHDFLEKWTVIQSVSGVGEILKGALPEKHSGGYRPVRNLIMLVEYQVFQANPLPYHLQGILVHISNTGLVFAIVYLLTKKHSIAWATSLLFGVHPGMMEAVAFITASFDTMGITFALISYLFFLRYSQTSHKMMALGAGVFLVLAFLTYELTYVLPLLFSFTALFFYRTRRMLKFLVFCGILVLAVYVLRTIIITNSVHEGIHTSDPYILFLLITRFLGEYISLLFVPRHLSIYHDFGHGFIFEYTQYIFESFRITDANTLLGIGSGIVLIAVAWMCRKRNPMVSFGIGWFFLAWLPVSNIIPVGAIFAERYIYFPALGLFLAGSSGFVSLITSERLRPYKRIGIGMGCLLIVLLGMLLLKRTVIWQNERIFWEYAMHDHPEDARIRTNLGVAYAAEGKLDNALEQYMRAYTLAPDSLLVTGNLSILLGKAGRVPQAIFFGEKAVNTAPDNTAVLHNLANLYVRDGRASDAAQLLELYVTPGHDVEFWTSLGGSAFQKNDLATSERSYRRALMLNPQILEAYIRISSIFIQTNRYIDAINSIKAAHMLGLNEPSLSYNLAIAYLQVNDKPKAKTAALKAAELAPDNQTIRHLVESFER